MGPDLLSWLLFLNHWSNLSQIYWSFPSVIHAGLKDGQQCSVTSRVSVRWVPVTNLWAALTNMVLYNIFGGFLVVRVAVWKKVLDIWHFFFFFFLIEGGKRICGRSSIAKILHKSIQEALGFLSATASVVHYLNSTAIYFHRLKRVKLSISIHFPSNIAILYLISSTSTKWIKF